MIELVPLYESVRNNSKYQCKLRCGLASTLPGGKRSPLKMVVYKLQHRGAPLLMPVFLVGLFEGEDKTVGPALVRMLMKVGHKIAHVN